MSWTLCSQAAARGMRRSMVMTAILAAALLAPLAGCGLLDVNDPTKVQEEDLENGTSAVMFRNGVIESFVNAYADEARLSGFLADEFAADPRDVLYPGAPELLDRRESELFEPILTESYNSPYFNLQQTRRFAVTALPFLRTYLQGSSLAASEAQLFALRGYSSLLLGEHYCPGFPLNEVKDGSVVRNPPFTTDQVFESALADFDSALAANSDSTAYVNLARIGRARTLLALGRFDEAGAAVTGVPTEYVYNIEYGTDGAYKPNPLYFSYSEYSTIQSATDREGGNGLDYISSHDPRVRVTGMGVAFHAPDSVYSLDKYSSDAAPVVLASGIEARLIEAEAALDGGGDWRGILNTLRRDWITPALTDTTDPGTQVQRENLLFRERAFWLYATGHRLGDVRRLIAHYGRAPESVLPSGEYWTGGAYAGATSIAFPAQKERADNPAITGCTTR